jgi:ribosome-associated protein
METFKIKGEFIQLNQLLKAVGWVDNGGEANEAIDGGNVKVNGQVELRKRNKIMAGFKVEMGGKSVMIEG